ncbi:L-serine ammonia-lyase [Novosphingobium sp. 1949]|uniref:L-serine dehydratase n=1 Tax=Novosphingobium organovorum TaxID=2930092 RepID=A0ABT0BGS5_9SPHN|nr:L-serine ammonia-lyase [Novosphingobium organovorum]MCJ2184270.1 L-serine ammonia-lyase [Novosphingobium organovorum]
MPVSVFELFKIGVGPSSSHTMGPMTAAARFTQWLGERGALETVHRVEATLYGSLALTGVGHATDTAVIVGLHGIEPADVTNARHRQILNDVAASGQIVLGGHHPIAFDETRDIVWRGRERLPFHSNAMRLTAFDAQGAPCGQRIYYSIGGGFVLDEDEAGRNAPAQPLADMPYPFATAHELLAMAREAGLTLAEVALANEDALRPRAETLAGIRAICDTMDTCIDAGISQTGELPGGLRVRRRAAGLHHALTGRLARAAADPLDSLDWVSTWAIAVNEQNAAGGRVVTAPTNGAAGVLPAVLRFYMRFQNGTPEGCVDFLMTATAIGGLFKRNASISAAEVGCQGEVGVACSMAAAGLCAVLGGTNAQIENAAEIGMEHNLGLTCDPIAGLVQIPCIERNAMGANKAISAARLALGGDGVHHVSLDQVIDTMKRTGQDMKEHYKETSLGGLAVAVPSC